MIYTFVAFCLVGSALAQVPGFGSCPEVETVKDFDISKYLGKWYEAERYFTAFGINVKCVTVDYSEGQNNTINVINTQVSESSGVSSSTVNIARVPNASEPAKLKIKLASIPFGIEGNYWILGTDYESYAVVYSCNRLALSNVKFAWILTREQNPSDEVIAKVDEIIEKNKLNRSSFRKVNQSDCESVNEE